MNNSRRTFVKSSAMAVIGAALLPRSVFASGAQKATVGIQLYSVRDDMKSDPKGSLKKLADMGYKVVEHAGYADRKFYGFAPSEFKKILADLGLTMYSGHVDFGMQAWDDTKKDFTDKWKQTVEDAAFMGQKYVITPELDINAQKDYDTLLKMIDLWNKCGELCRKYGMKFGYHDDFNENAILHNMKIYDIIMKNADPKLTIQQFDIANLYNAAGTDPMDIIKEILSGIKSKNNFEVEENRELAIKNGIAMSKKNDIILICGKGHETYQEVKGIKSHFDDKEIVAKYINLAAE